MDDSKTSLDEAAVLHTTRNGIEAFGIYDGEKFEVLEGSQVNIDKKVNLERYNKQRAELLENGSITKTEILNALNADNVKIEKNQIKDFPSIKAVGEYKITLQFIKEVSVDIVASVNVK